MEGIAASAASCECEACPLWWHGMAGSASAIVGTGMLAVPCPSACICIICTDAMAEAAPLNTKAMHSNKRNRMARVDMALL